MGWTAKRNNVQATDLRQFGEDVTYEPDGGGTLTVRAIFRSAHEALDTETLAPVVSAQPVFDVRRGAGAGFDLTVDPVPMKDHIVRADGVRWTVIHVEPDGEGILRLVCQKRTAD